MGVGSSPLVSTMETQGGMPVVSQTATSAPVKANRGSQVTPFSRDHGHLSSPDLLSQSVTYEFLRWMKQLLSREADISVSAELATWKEPIVCV